MALVACPPVARALAHWWTSHQGHSSHLIYIASVYGMFNA